MLFANLKDKLVNFTTDFVSISPFTHLKSKFELLLSNLKNECYLLLFLKLDGEWNLLVLNTDFVHLDDLVEVRVKSLRNSSVLSQTIELLAERKNASSSLVVELKQLAVGSKSVKDAFANVQEESSAGLNGIFLFEGIKACVCKEH